MKGVIRHNRDIVMRMYERDDRFYWNENNDNAVQLAKSMNCRLYQADTQKEREREREREADRSKVGKWCEII